MTTRPRGGPAGRERAGRQPSSALQLVGPDGLPPSVPRADADPLDEPGSGGAAGAAPGTAAADTDPSECLSGSLALPARLPAPPVPAAPPMPARTATDGPRIPVPARPGGAGPRPPRSVRMAADRVRPPTGPRTSHPATHALAERMRQRAESFVGDDPVLAQLRARAQERGVATLGAGAAAAVAFLAAATRARAVVEIGTGLGVGAVSTLRGMPADGVLTTIDVEVEHQRAARTAAVAAGFPPGRIRMITGRALAVLPRLSDAGYDLVVVDGDAGMAREYPRYVEEALRLLRPGGVLALAGVMAGLVSEERLTAGAGAAERDAELSALREASSAVREDDRWVPVMLPISDGLLCAARGGP